MDGRGRKGESKVVVMYGAGAGVVSQRDLVEERILREQAYEAMKLWKKKRIAIRKALNAGARIEPGARSASVELTEILRVR